MEHRRGLTRVGFQLGRHGAHAKESPILSLPPRAFRECWECFRDTLIRRSRPSFVVAATCGHSTRRAFRAPRTARCRPSEGLGDRRGDVRGVCTPPPPPSLLLLLLSLHFLAACSSFYISTFVSLERLACFGRGTKFSQMQTCLRPGKFLLRRWDFR